MKQKSVIKKIKNRIVGYRPLEEEEMLPKCVSLMAFWCSYLPCILKTISYTVPSRKGTHEVTPKASFC